MSPDGRRIAFCSSRGVDTVEIFVAAADGSDAHQLTHGPGRFQGSPHWSPKGQRIAFHSQGDDGHWHIWTIDADGGAAYQVTKMPGDQNVPSWSWDGDSLYFAAENGTGRDIWRTPAAGGVPKQVTEGGTAIVGRESADGKAVIYHPHGQDSLWSQPLAGGSAHELVKCSSGYFSVGKQGVYFIPCNAHGKYAVHLLDSVTGRDRLFGILENFSPNYNIRLSISSDGSSLLYDRVVADGANLMLIENFR